MFILTSPPYPLPPFSPSLISLMVSVDVSTMCTLHVSQLGRAVKALKVGKTGGRRRFDSLLQLSFLFESLE